MARRGRRHLTALSNLAHVADCLICARPIAWKKCYRPDCTAGASELAKIHAERAKSRERAARTAQVRTPPKWPGAKVPGRCNLCLAPVPKGRQTWCSQTCVDIWFLATTPNVQAAHLRLTYEGCFECGVLTRQTEVDHIKPLWSLEPHERRELKWWLPFNLQLLCDECHKAKTKREAAVRAALRRGQAGDPLDQPALL